MADDRHRHDYPQQNRPEESQYQPTPVRPRESSQEGARSTSSDTDAAHPYPRSTMATSLTLPSIQDSRHSGYGPPPPHPPRGYPGDPRYTPPSAVNGYPPPSGGQQQPAGSYLPPLQPQADPRFPSYMSPESRYYEDRRPPAAHPPHGYLDQYSADYYYRGHQQGPPGAGYAHDYRGHHPGYAPEYGQSGGDRPREAPRQRTSIACIYCRKRKIRCSGHQNAPGGKCQNCARMNQECIFQPVSSSSSTAFIPVSAVPGGVPPGTQLFGAYGQPLAPGSLPTQPPPPPYPSAGPGAPPHHHHPSYYPSAQSPTDSYAPYGDGRGEDPMMGRRRRRTPEEREEGYRLPPPRASGIPEEDSRRRSPAEFSNDSSPRSFSYPRYSDPSRHSPRNPTLPHPTSLGGGGGDGRSSAVQSGSSGASTPGRPVPPAAQGQGSSVMSLSNLVDIDKTMIDRLNRSRDAPPNATAAGQNGLRRENSR